MVALAPAVLLFAIVAHPFIARLPDARAVGDAVEAGTTSWGIVHLLTAVGSILVALAFLAIREFLRDAGAERSGAWALPFVIAGSFFYGLLPALEFAPMGAALAGGDPEATQAALQPWFVAILPTSALLFAIGVFGFARGIAVARVLSRPLTRLVVTALVVWAVSRFVPLGVVQFYVQGLAGIVALWPLVLRMWRQPDAAPVGTSSAV